MIDFEVNGCKYTRVNLKYFTPLFNANKQNDKFYYKTVTNKFVGKSRKKYLRQF